MTTPTPPSLALEEQLCFALHRASRAVTRGYAPLLDRLGLTYPQYLAMLALWQAEAEREPDEEPPGVGALRDRLGMDNGTITPLVRRLADLGLVERRRGVDDERRVRVHLTDAGRALRAQAESVPTAILEHNPLDADERRVLMGLLNRISAAAPPR